MTIATFEVRHTRPDEYLRELALNVQDRSLQDGFVRLAVVRHRATRGDLNPNLKGWPDGDKPLHTSIEARWLEAGYVARGQMYRLSTYLGLAKTERQRDETDGSWERWQTISRETSEQELELVHQLSDGIKAHEGLEIRTGGLHGEDPGWRAHEEIAAPQAPQVCATCEQPIRFSNAAWRHEDTGRAEIYSAVPCPACSGTRVVQGRRGEERCRACETTPGMQLTLEHLADPATKGRLI